MQNAKVSFAYSAVILLIVVAAALGGRDKTPTTHDVESVRNELAALERRSIVAVQRKDLETLNEIWDEQYFGTAPNGATVTKSDLMAAVKDGVIEITSIEPDDLKMRLFGEVAVMTERADAKAMDVRESFSARVRGTGNFVNRDGKWKIAGVHVGPNDLERPIAEAAR